MDKEKECVPMLCGQCVVREESVNVDTRAICIIYFTDVSSEQVNWKSEQTSSKR